MKKLILFLFTCSCLLTACSNDKSNESTTDKKDSMSNDNKNTMAAESKVERNRQTALASVMAVNSHDADAMLKDATPDAMDYGDGSMKPVKGLDSIKAGIKAWLAAFPDIKGENIEAFANADGSKVIVVGEWTGTFKNDFMGMKATNKSYKLWDGDMFTFNDAGKMIDHRSIQSNMTMAAQVGFKMGK